MAEEPKTSSRMEAHRLRQCAYRRRLQETMIPEAQHIDRALLLSLRRLAQRAAHSSDMTAEHRDAVKWLLVTLKDSVLSRLEAAGFDCRESLRRLIKRLAPPRKPRVTS